MKQLAAAMLFAAVAVGGCSSGPDLTPRSGIPVDAQSLTWEGKTFGAGDRIVTIKRAGTFKPADTGHASEINVDGGHGGLVLGGMHRDPRYAKPGEAIQIALVRFDAQSWTDATGATVELGEFEATIHADYLQPAP